MQPPGQRPLPAYPVGRLQPEARLRQLRQLVCTRVQQRACLRVQQRACLRVWVRLRPCLRACLRVQLQDRMEAAVIS